jgi:hypothetical protein
VAAAWLLHSTPESGSNAKRLVDTLIVVRAAQGEAVVLFVVSRLRRGIGSDIDDNEYRSKHHHRETDRLGERSCLEHEDCHLILERSLCCYSADSMERNTGQCL